MSINYIVKINNNIKPTKFVVVDNSAVGLTADMLLSMDEIIFDIVHKRLTNDDKMYFINCTDDDLIAEHLGFGMWIRNRYALWEIITNPLIDENPAPDSIKHPDNCSGMIMRLVRDTLRGDYYPDSSLPQQETDFEAAMKIVGDK